jgi:outer membrane lipoprotein-sorting protein
MFRIIATAIVTVAAFLSVPAAGQEADLTLDQIVQKHTEALGGGDKLKAIQSVTMTGKASLQDGQIEASLTMKVKRPTSMRMEMSVLGKTFIQAFDGTTAWIINPFVGSDEPQKQTDEDTKSARDDADFIDGSLVDYKTKGNTLELLGKEDVEGKPAYKIKVTKKGGTVENDYLDAKTFLPVKSSGKRKQQGQDIEYESTPGNFKEVNGVMMPFSLSQKVDGKVMMDLKVEKVEVNLPMDAAVFQMPDKPKPEKPKEEKKEPPKQ